MEQIHDRADETAKRPNATWLQLSLEVMVFSGIGVLLCLAGARIPDGRADAGFVFAILVALHAGGVVRFVLRASEFLELECPVCTHSFHGLPDRLPKPFRRHCAHCGSHL
jgi:hypothetical protein